MDRLKRGLTIKARNAVAGYLFIATWIVGFFAFTIYPAVYSVLLSLNTVMIKPTGIVMQWSGLYYYNQAWNVDTNFKINLGNSAMFIGCATPVILVFALLIAMLLNGKYPLRLLFRAVFFLPVIIMSGPVISQLLTEHTVDFSENSSAVYTYLGTLPTVISKPTLFILNNLVLILWFSGVQILIFLAGLTKISPEIYEAASIDGAGGWGKFWKITLPYIQPVALIAAVYTVIDIANFSNSDVNTQITNNLFQVNRPYSFSAAMSWIYFVLIVLILLVVFALFYGFGRRERAQ